MGASCLTGIMICQIHKEFPAHTLSDFFLDSHVVRPPIRHVFSPSAVVLNCIAMVGVAQLVERRTVAPNVVGSNPISHPKTQNQSRSCIVRAVVDY